MCVIDGLPYVITYRGRLVAMLVPQRGEASTNVRSTDA